jgi:hypothetical protein
MQPFHAANLCVPGMMSVCTAGSRWEDQKCCKFYQKASVANRCMHYREMLGGHCDCVAAQKEIRGY